MVIDKLCFRTNKNNKIELGGDGGGSFSVIAPEGYHFAVFGGYCSEFLNSI